MIETRIYKCEYCGAEFDDEYEANCHEYVCQYEDVKKREGSLLAFYDEDGSRIKFNIQTIYDELNNVAAFTVGNDDDVKFVIGTLGWVGYDNPFRAIENEVNPNYYGLWYFAPDLNYYGEWVRVDDQIKKWKDIKNKFTKDA